MVFTHKNLRLHVRIKTVGSIRAPLWYDFLCLRTVHSRWDAGLDKVGQSDELRRKSRRKWSNPSSHSQHPTSHSPPTPRAMCSHSFHLWCQALSRWGRKPVYMGPDPPPTQRPRRSSNHLADTDPSGARKAVTPPPVGPLFEIPVCSQSFAG